MPRFLKLSKYQQNPVILMQNMKAIQSELMYCFMHTYAYLELFKPVFSLNKQIFQLFQFIRAILKLLNHPKRLKFQNSKILYLECLNYDK